MVCQRTNLVEANPYHQLVRGGFTPRRLTTFPEPACHETFVNRSP